MKIIETMKDHPYITAGMGVAAVVAFFMLGGSSGGGAGAGTPGDAVSTGVDVQNWQAQMAAQSAATASDLQKTLGAQATAITIEGLRAQSAYDIGTLQAGLGYANIDAQKSVSIAGILAQEKATQEETKRLNLTTSQTVAMQQIMADTINRQTDAQRAVSIDSHQPHGLFSMIFG